MPRVKYPSISAIAGDVLREVKAEEQIKTAEAQVLRGTLAPACPETELSADLRKLASDCRTQTGDITYADLQEFMTHAK
jgi:hypothetical protein